MCAAPGTKAGKQPVVQCTLESQNPLTLIPRGEPRILCLERSQSTDPVPHARCAGLLVDLLCAQPGGDIHGAVWANDLDFASAGNNSPICTVDNNSPICTVS